MSEVSGTKDENGPYRIIRVVGSGGMGTVHEAWDLRLDRRVALKMLHPHLVSDASVSACFEREAKKAARIEHPNVVRVYRVDSYQGRVAIEMQFVDGTALSALLRSGPLSLEHAAELLRQILEALQACHEHAVIHCDLKPGNLLVTRDGQVLLTDFGIARALLGECGSDVTLDPVSGKVWGTPQYSPPEAWEGGSVTPRWDLYAAGVLMYEAITGAPAFRGQTPAALMNAILATSPPPLKVARPEVSEGFSDLIASLMERDPEKRLVSARAALTLLRETPEFGMSAPDTESLQISLPPVATEKDKRLTTPVLPDAPRRHRGVAVLWVPAVTLLALAFLYIYARPGATPAELTAPAAVPVKSVPGVTELQIVNDDVIFVSDDEIHGRELWHIAPSGECSLLSDIVPGPVSSDPRRLWARPRGGVVFAATTPGFGEELWFGLDTGGGHFSVRMIKDIISGPMGSDPEPIAAEDTLVLFYATTLVAGRELWCTNVNEGQTAMVADVFAGVDGSVPMNPRICADAEGAYIVALTDVDRGCVLYRYDYATNVMREVGDVADDAAAMARIGKKLLLTNADAANGSELWLYDETDGDFRLLADLRPGPESSSPAQFFAWDDRTLFQARTESHGTELWISDGTEAGTTLVSDINSGPGDSDPYGFVLCGAHIFFRATDEACGRELWVTDGTREGTTRVTDVLPGSASSEPYNLVACEQSLLFTANDGVHGEELWGAGLIDGTWKAGLLRDLYPGLPGSEPHQLQRVNNQLAYFLAKTPETGESVYVISGIHGTFVDADNWSFQVMFPAARHEAP